MNESLLWLGHRMSLTNHNIYMQWFRVNTNQIHRCIQNSLQIRP